MTKRCAVPVQAVTTDMLPQMSMERTPWCERPGTADGGRRRRPFAVEQPFDRQPSGSRRPVVVHYSLVGMNAWAPGTCRQAGFGKRQEATRRLDARANCRSPHQTPLLTGDWLAHGLAPVVRSAVVGAVEHGLVNGRFRPPVVKSGGSDGREPPA